MASTFRASVRSGIASILTTYRAANPTLLASVYDHRPPSFLPPLAFVGGINEPIIQHSSGIRHRQASAQIVIVHRAADNDSTSDQMDVLVDGIIDAITAAPHAVSGAILQGDMSVEDADIQLGAETVVTYVGTIINVRIDIDEGRS